MATMKKTLEIVVCDRCGRKLGRREPVKVTLIFENGEGSEKQHVLEDCCPGCAKRILKSLKKRGEKEEKEE